MAKCKYCGKPTPYAPYCTQHNELWHKDNYPDRTCVFCGKQLFPQGISKSQYFKVVFCNHKCKSDFQSYGLVLRSPFLKVSQLVRPVVSFKMSGCLAQVNEDLVNKVFNGTIVFADKSVKETRYFNSAREAALAAIKEINNGIELW